MFLIWVLSERTGQACGTKAVQDVQVWKICYLSSTRMCFSGRCRPRGRTMRVAILDLSAYCFPDLGSVKAMLRLIASRRLICPSIWFCLHECQVFSIGLAFTAPAIAPAFIQLVFGFVQTFIILGFRGCSFR